MTLTDKVSTIKSEEEAVGDTTEGARDPSEVSGEVGEAGEIGGEIGGEVSGEVSGETSGETSGKADSEPNGEVEAEAEAEAEAETETEISTSTVMESPLFQLLLAQKVYELGDMDETFSRIANDLNEHPLLLEQVPDIENEPVNTEKCHSKYLEMLASEGLAQGEGQWIMRLAEAKYEKFVASLEQLIAKDEGEFVTRVNELAKMSEESQESQ